MSSRSRQRAHHQPPLIPPSPEALAWSVQVQAPSSAGVPEGAKTRRVSWRPSSSAAAAAGAVVPGHTTSSWVAQQAAGMQEQPDVPAEIMQLRELVAAADGGDPAAALELGMLLREGQVLQQAASSSTHPADLCPPILLPLQALASAAASADAQVIEPDPVEALEYLRIAAEAGDPEACYMVSCSRGVSAPLFCYVPCTAPGEGRP